MSPCQTGAGFRNECITPHMTYSGSRKPVFRNDIIFDIRAFKLQSGGSHGGLRVRLLCVISNRLTVTCRTRELRRSSRVPEHVFRVEGACFLWGFFLHLQVRNNSRLEVTPGEIKRRKMTRRRIQSSNIIIRMLLVNKSLKTFG